MFVEDCLPKLKPTVEMTILENSLLLTHGEDTLMLEEDTDFFKALCEKMDGNTLINEIVKEIKARFPNKSKLDVENVIAQMDELLLLENNLFTLNKGKVLDQMTLERWGRNIDFFGSLCSLNENKFEIQAKLKNMKVGLLGLGGLGSNIIYSLAALGVENIVAADFDKIELSNLNRQILYKTKDIGTEKSKTAEKRIKEFYPDIKTKIHQIKFQSVEDIESIIQDCDIVIGVADKPRVKMPIWMNEACVNNNIPFISGGVNITRGVIYSVIPGVSGCVTCWRQHANQLNKFNEKIYENIKDTHKEFETPYSWPAVIPLVSLVSGAMITEMIKIATGLSKPSFNNKLTQIDFKNIESKVVETWSKDSKCKTCQKAR